MEFTCKQCGAKFRAAVQTPVASPVRLACPACRAEMILRPRKPTIEQALPEAAPPPRRVAVIADEPRAFRKFLGDQLERMAFDVVYFETGDPALEHARRVKADLVIVNVYLKGKLGVEVSEEIKKDPTLSATRVILIGALFRANRFRANPTNLYGADEYIEEQIPEKEFRQIIRKLYPEIGPTGELRVEPPEYEEARRLARLILSDIVIYHAPKVERALKENRFFEMLHQEIEEGRQYYDSKVPLRVRRDTEIFNETLQQFVQMKREELKRARMTT
jgi:response regulator RpfG family c-di-GMP phosphodiesterase